MKTVNSGEGSPFLLLCNSLPSNRITAFVTFSLLNPAGNCCCFKLKTLSFVAPLSYKKLNIDTRTQAAIIEAIEVGGILIEPPTSVVHFSDETDRIFYDTAKASGAILITGNIKHFPNDPFIMTPADFLEKAAKN